MCVGLSVSVCLPVCLCTGFFIIFLFFFIPPPPTPTPFPPPPPFASCSSNPMGLMGCLNPRTNELSCFMFYCICCPTPLCKGQWVKICATLFIVLPEACPSVVFSPQALGTDSWPCFMAPCLLTSAWVCPALSLFSKLHWNQWQLGSCVLNSSLVSLSLLSQEALRVRSSP